MAKRPFFRADQVGSLLRPPSVQAARRRWRNGEIGRDELRAAENEAIGEMVRRQEEIGLLSVTDGEVRRENWWIDFARAIPGISIEQPAVSESFAGNRHVPLNVTARERIVWREPVMAADFRDLAALTKVTPKITIPSPSRLHFHAGDGVADPAAYPDIDAFWSDVVAFYRAEIRALEEAGCRYIQLDDPVMSYFVDPRHRAHMQERGLDPDTTLSRYVEVINQAIAERRDDTLLSLHICRGNARSSWVASGGYDAIADLVFPTLKVDALFLEFDDDRSGDFGPLKKTDGQKIMLGLLTTKTGALEDRDLILRRIDEASAVMPLEWLAVSPQCGFASTEEGNVLTEEDQWKKLKLCVDLACEVWGRIDG
ncbi:5-methyltetrahydropteroyltriglutamate--homocysteine S-methyltransferase [Chelativorans sp.]|uniref:5-methyltetrahydropteroyltriglutamate-- homocysteine S-methyltransferase n=1 Tax=Chelativorans sp. TaxID=2203393 RepID=UPI002811DE70|nr:5-methyltetrahydropteroyltriglutamate--homocysteine S-methyltransferase [Chelativorans sp.]